MGGNKGREKIRLNITSNLKNMSRVLVLQGGISDEKEVSEFLKTLSKSFFPTRAGIFILSR